MDYFKRAISGLMVFLFLVASLPIHSAHAATLTVSNANDSGVGSLRQAIADASAGDTITFDGDYTILLESTLLIDKDLTIDGSGHTIKLDGQNAHRVITIAEEKIVSLKHLYIQNGFSNYSSGGGIFSQGTLTLTDSIITNNTVYGERGGGMEVQSATGTTIEDTVFSGNTASFNGGGLYANNSDNLTIINSTFSNNTTGDHDYGGGLYAKNSDNLTIINSTFSGNTALRGGGLYAYYSHNLTLTNSIFDSNTTSGDGSLFGGGLYAKNSDNLTMTNSTFSGNTANYGGGLYANYSNNLAMTNSTFSGNTAAGNGGGLYADNSALTLTNSTFTGNDASYGGGIGSGSNSTLTLINSTFSSNTASYGGGFNRYESGDATIYNSVFWGNSPDQILNEENPTDVTIHDSVIQNGCPNYSDCTNIITADPKLGTLANYGGATQTLALLTGSSAIDSGNADNCPATYQRGVSRPQGAGCDIGAYEFGPAILTLADDDEPATLTSLYSIEVNFSEDALHDFSENAANHISNYLLVEIGDNNAFDTLSCAAGVVGDDEQETISSALYDNNSGAGPFTATLYLSAALDAGNKYRLFICGTTSIWSAAGLKLNNGESDTIVDFSVSLPATGFRHGEVTQLAEQPAAKAYTDTAMMLEIPKLGVSTPIVGVAQSGSEWDVTWLGNSAGYLYGSAFPTWAGNTVITGHVWDAYNQPGVFAEIKSLKYGDQIEIHAWGATYTYEVRESKLVATKNMNAVFQSEEYDWVTLVTCEFYNPFSGEYLFRRVVRAVLVGIQR
jgi:LPXTG-site transpeptidase (sortase) family protein